MNTKLFSVRSIVSEAFSTVFSAAALPLIFIVCLMNIFSETVQLLKPIANTIDEIVGAFGFVAMIGFFVIVVGIGFLLLTLYGFISTHISLLIVDKKSITWSNILPSKIIFIRFFCKLLILLLLVTFFTSLDVVLIIMSKQFNFFIKSILYFVSACVFIFGLYSLIKLSFTSYFIVEDVGVIDSFKKSWNITKGYIIKILGIIVCILFADTVIGIISRIITMIIPLSIWLPILLRIIVMSLTSAAYYLAFARVYRILTHSDAAHSLAE